MKIHNKIKDWSARYIHENYSNYLAGHEKLVEV
jgi:hypothetical protein